MGASTSPSFEDSDHRNGAAHGHPISRNPSLAKVFDRQQLSPPHTDRPSPFGIHSSSPLRLSPFPPFLSLHHIFSLRCAPPAYPIRPMAAATALIFYPLIALRATADASRTARVGSWHHVAVAKSVPVRRSSNRAPIALMVARRLTDLSSSLPLSRRRTVSILSIHRHPAQHLPFPILPILNASTTRNQRQIFTLMRKHERNPAVLIGVDCLVSHCNDPTVRRETFASFPAKTADTLLVATAIAGR